jgi:hypothetical protein
VPKPPAETHANPEKAMSKKNPLAAALLALALSVGSVHTARAQVSEASALSLLPVAVSIAAPVLVVSGTLALTVVAVEASAKGTVWVLERASDGARMSVTFAAGASAAVGTAVLVTAVSTGWVISAAGAALAFIPNEIGRALLHNERIGR